MVSRLPVNGSPVFRRCLVVLFLLHLFTPACSGGEPELRVLILGAQAPQWIAITVREPGWALAGQALSPGAVVACKTAGGGLVIDGRVVPAGTARLSGPGPGAVFELVFSGTGRRYPGGLRIAVVDGSLRLVNLVPLESYVAAVLAVEALPPRPPHAGEAAYLRALAVVVRSYADYYRGRLARHAETGADLCDQTHCQAYRGIAGQLIHREAAAATAGIVLRKDGRLVPGYHSSTCAGRTALPAEAWGGAGFAGVYLNIDDVDADGRPLCAASPHLAWRFALPADELTEIVSRECFPLGRIEELEFEYGADERVARVRSPEGEVAGEAFRNAVCRVHGWGSLRSLAFHMRRERGMAVFTGRGLGHAVGFCQYGARALADRIHDWRQLLARYFPGLTTQR